MTVSFCVAQLNPVVGDVQGNLAKALEAVGQAAQRGCDLIVFPELFLSGYPAEDLLYRPAFLADCARALQELVERSVQWPRLHIIMGYPEAVDPGHPLPRDSDFLAPAWNAVCVVHNGLRAGFYRKQALPNYGVFDEKRYFVSSAVFTHNQAFDREQQACHGVVEIAGIRVGLMLCEDAWIEEPAAHAKAAGAQVLVVMNASPFVVDKPGRRQQLMQQRVRETGLPLLYAHMTGGQDELVFDGHSFALNADASPAGNAPGFEICLWQLALQSGGAGQALQWQTASTGGNTLVCDAQQQMWQALVLATRDYVQKNGFRKVLLGLSGGVDSALVLTIAVDALGADNVLAVMMPSPYTASISLEDSRDMVARLGVAYDEIGIRESFETLKGALASQFAGRAEDTTEENLQARIRGVILMALSNKSGALLLTTGNKSEVAMGYATLYGDMCGGFGPLKDVYKTDAYALARWRNAHALPGCVANPIPQRIITRAPSAELRADQTDQDSLPPYEMLDAILRMRMDLDCSAGEIIAHGYPQERVQQVLGLLRINEYKRRQAAPGPKLSARAFGRDWRYPITNGYRG